jgi:hypothetical protein
VLLFKPPTTDDGLIAIAAGANAAVVACRFDSSLPDEEVNPHITASTPAAAEDTGLRCHQVANIIGWPAATAMRDNRGHERRHLGAGPVG